MVKNGAFIVATAIFWVAVVEMEGDVVAGGKIREIPSYIECVSSDECPMNSCCLLGMGRFSVPTCKLKLERNERCRPNSQNAVNSTVSYMDGNVVSLQNVHLILCPCSLGLFCHSSSGTCRDFDTNSFNNNAINSIQEYEDGDEPLEKNYD